MFEGYAFAGGTSIETINHGYLAVDFSLFYRGLSLAMRMMTVGERHSR